MSTFHLVLDAVLLGLLLIWSAISVYLFIATLVLYRPTVALKLVQGHPAQLRRTLSLILFPLLNMVLIILLAGVTSIADPLTSTIFSVLAIIMGLTSLFLCWLIYHPLLHHKNKKS